jgi:hypothetical protein
MSEQDIARIFKTMNIKQLEWTYLLDVAWQQMADKPEIKAIENVDEQALTMLAELLSIKISNDLRFLHELVLAISSQDFARAVCYARYLPERLDTTEVKNMFRFQRYEAVALTTESVDLNTDLWSGSIFHTGNRSFEGELIKKGDLLGRFRTKKHCVYVIAPHAGVVARQVKELTLVDDGSGRIFTAGEKIPEIGQIWGTLYRTEFDEKLTHINIQGEPIHDRA